MKNIVKEIKTTLAGLGLFAFVWFKYADLSDVLIIVFILLGIALLIAKDKLTLGLETLIKRKSEKL